MVYLMLTLCAVSLTYSVFLIARFGIKRKESSDFIRDEQFINTNKD